MRRAPTARAAAGRICDVMRAPPSPPCRGRPRSRAGPLRISAGVPSAIFSPRSSTVMRSETPMTTLMSCSMSSTVSPRSSRTLLHERREAAALLRVHAGRRLVEQQQLRLAARARARPRAGAGRRTAGCARLVVARRPMPTNSSSSAARSRASAPRAAGRGCAGCVRQQPALEVLVHAPPSRSPARSCCRTGGCSGTCAPCRAARCGAAAGPVMPSPSSLKRRRRSSAGRGR